MNEERVFLIVREKNKALKTAEIINNLGYKSKILPLYKIELLDVKLPDLNNIQGFIFTSTNGFNLDFLDYWKIANKNITFFIIGYSLARLLKKHQINNYKVFNSGQDLITYFNSQSIRLSYDNDDVKAKQFIYFRGTEVKYNLQLALPRYNILEKISYKASYGNNFNVKRDIVDSNITDILFFSLYNAKYFLSLFTQREMNLLDKYRIYCLSAEISEAFIRKGLKNTYNPKIPNMNELIKIL